MLQKKDKGTEKVLEKKENAISSAHTGRQTSDQPHERYFIPNYYFNVTDCFAGRKGGTAAQVRKGISHKHVDLPRLASIKFTGVCIPTGNREILLAAVCKSQGHAWNDVVIMDL
jgi:hypothetical protein